MQKWEYLEVRCAYQAMVPGSEGRTWKYDQRGQMLKELGEEGWEFAGVLHPMVAGATTYNLVFKRARGQVESAKG